MNSGNLDYVTELVDILASYMVHLPTQKENSYYYSQHTVFTSPSPQLNILSPPPPQHTVLRPLVLSTLFLHPLCVRRAQRGTLREISVDTQVSTLTRRGRH